MKEDKNTHIGMQKEQIGNRSCAPFTWAIKQVDVVWTLYASCGIARCLARCSVKVYRTRAIDIYNTNNWHLQ